MQQQPSLTEVGTSAPSQVSITVHRGTDAIGGSCIEISTLSGRLILDHGMPLMADGGGDLDPQDLDKPSMENGILRNIPGLYDAKSDIPIVGVVLSHAHPDHYGLLNFVHPSIPVWMSEESLAMIKVANIFLSQQLRMPELAARCSTFTNGSPFSLGKFIINPLLIDHSAFGASSLLIEVAGKRILYSGDIRAHGRKQYTFETLPERVGHIDCMLMEGTTLGGKHQDGYNTETEVEEGFLQHFASDGATFVMASGSNIDRTVSLYRASKRANKMLVLDLYQYYLLCQCKAFSKGLPPHDGDHLRVFFFDQQRKRLEELGMYDFLREASPREIDAGGIIRDAKRMVIRLGLGMMGKLADKMNHQQSMRFIYSMWQGYLSKGEKGKKFAAMPRAFGHEWEHVHTSGHAWREDLQSLVKKIQPDKLVPIHTLQGDKFAEYFDNVVRVGDGESVGLFLTQNNEFHKRGY